MALILNYNVEIQTTRKVLTVVDDSVDWNTDHYQLANYYLDNAAENLVRLNIDIEVKGAITSSKFILTKGINYELAADETAGYAFGTVGVPVVDASELRFSILLSLQGDLVLINDLTNIDYDEYGILPDGIYTIEYVVSSGTDGLAPITYKEEFVVTNAAEQVVTDEANKIADTLLTCRDTDIDTIADYLVNESLLFAANKAAFISRKNRILNILNVLNKD